MQNFNVVKQKKKLDTANKVFSYQPHKSLKVLACRELTDSAYVLRLERKNIKFRSGQHISLGTGPEGETREYSIYSGEQDGYLEVLIKEVDEGLVSKALKKCKAGDSIRFDGPVGYFQIKEEDLKNKKFLFVASGTGVAPFHSFMKSYPDLDYKLLHGIRYRHEAYEAEDYPEERRVICTTRDDRGDFKGRVTDYLKQHPVDNNTLVYLCGNCEMIHDAYDILLDQGMAADDLHSEVYF